MIFEPDIFRQDIVPTADADFFKNLDDGLRYRPTEQHYLLSVQEQHVHIYHLYAFE